MNKCPLADRGTFGTWTFLSNWPCHRDGRLRAKLEQVYRQHRQALFSLALTITGCSALAEDAVHDAFARLCGKEHSPEGQLTSYVFAAVRNAAVDQRRIRHREPVPGDSLFAEALTTDIDRTGDAWDEEMLRLRQAIQQLDENAREIIVMKVFGGLTFGEIGAVLDTPPATVATRYRRTLTALQEKLRREA